MRRASACLLLGCLLLVGSLNADHRVIVRAVGGTSTLNVLCTTLGCTVQWPLGDPDGQVFLVTIPDTVNVDAFLASLSSKLFIVNVEVDRPGAIAQNNLPAPAALYDTSTVPYFGTNVMRGYVDQPAAQIIRLPEAREAFGAAGNGITVAVIDTGVDPNHPALRNVLVAGYDFTRNQPNGSETADVNQSTAAVVDGSPLWVNSTTLARIDQSTAAVVDTSANAAFGHGTMVAGIIHLVSPHSSILPLKAFRADGTGYTSDIIRAVYWAVRRNARVINMSFGMPHESREVKAALTFANNSGVTCVASAGNNNSSALVYPAAFTNVSGVASTTNQDTRSSFSNYGPAIVWAAAPGEGVVTTYPFGSYSAGWGTSFSTPFVAGTAALVAGFRPGLNPSGIASAIGQGAVPLTADLNRGRLDTYQAIQAAANQPAP